MTSDWIAQFVQNLPRHDCGLYLEHNHHKDVYETVEQYTLEDQDAWVSDESRQYAYDNQELWRLQWYPVTPVGFHVILAGRFEDLIEALQADPPHQGGES